jgi:hypothetical protein
MILRTVKVGDVSEMVYVSSGTNRRKAAALRRVKAKKRLMDALGRIRKQAQPRHTILDPIDYSGSWPDGGQINPAVERLLRRGR